MNTPIFIQEDTKSSLVKISNTKQQCALVEKLLGPGSPEEVMVNRFHISLRRSDFWLLHDEQLLNDKVILLFDL